MGPAEPVYGLSLRVERDEVRVGGMLSDANDDDIDDDADDDDDAHDGDGDGADTGVSVDVVDNLAERRVRGAEIAVWSSEEVLILGGEGGGGVLRGVNRVLPEFTR